MKKSLKKIVLFAAALVVVASLSSCNRGYGCPSNFSLDSSLIDFAKSILDFLF